MSKNNFGMTVHLTKSEAATTFKTKDETELLKEPVLPTMKVVKKVKVISA